MDDVFGNQSEMEAIEKMSVEKKSNEVPPPPIDENVVQMIYEIEHSGEVPLEIGDLIKLLLEAKHTRVVEAEAKVDYEKKRQLAIEKILIEKLQHGGQTSAKIKGLASVSLSPKIYFSSLKEKEEEKMAWFRGHEEYKHCIKETVFPQTFKKVMEEVYQKDGKVPDFVTYYPETKLSTRRSR